MYGKILVPVDGSLTATLGLREALKLAKAHGAQIRLIHVLDELAAAIFVPAGGELIAQLRNAGTSILNEAAAAARDAHVAVDTKLIEITGGRAGAYIVQEAQTWPADLIVCEVPIVAYCPTCAGERRPESPQLLCCGTCGTPMPEIIRGRELEVVALEIES